MSNSTYIYHCSFVRTHVGIDFLVPFFYTSFPFFLYPAYLFMVYQELLFLSLILLLRLFKIFLPHFGKQKSMSRNLDRVVLYILCCSYYCYFVVAVVVVE